MNDAYLDLAIGTSAGTKSWKNKKVKWDWLASKLKSPVKTSETSKEYQAAPKSERSKMKDVGGYVGGYLRGGRRKPENVMHRQLITLDLDYAHLDFWDDFCMLFNNAAVVHSTHSHTDETPKYRLIMPLSREVSPDEYSAISRKIAGLLDIDLFDNTGFQTMRLMFWPSVSKDAEYIYYRQKGDWIDADSVLNMYTDWTDSSAWPTAKKSIDAVLNASKKQEDPHGKKGIVGAFCRAYTIQEAIDSFLSEIYLESVGGRYTYVNGSTASGLVVYDGKFAFSHHGTDPCSEKLCNVFDLVRIHKFAHLDDERSSSIENRLKSYKAMEQFARDDKKVRALIAQEKIGNAKYDFEEDFEEDFDAADEEIDLSWAEDLEVDTKGRYLSSAGNFNLVFLNDYRLKDAFKFNSFDNKRYIFHSVPWRKIDAPEPMKNVDYSGVRNYIESVYGMVGTLKIDDALALEFQRQSFHPVQEYLQELQWDGVNRVDNLLIDYFGAKDDLYSRESIRKTLTGAVARIFNPGVKFDLVLVIVGGQGLGKSTFAKALGKNWFSDSFMTVHGKEAFEQLQGGWIIEFAELSAMRKAEVEAVKHFISKQEDTYRPAYGKTTETYKRQCVFIGTTNSTDFLTDPTGNRRFMPVDADKYSVKKNIFKIQPEEIDQVWAEAVQIYKSGEKLYLSKNAETMAKKEQISHSKDDERKGILEIYLDRKLPKTWKSMTLADRIDYLEDPLSMVGTEERDFVCVAEIWCEAMLLDRKNMDRYKTKPINEMMRSMDGWQYHNSTKNFPLYGKQKYYSRKLS